MSKTVFVIGCNGYIGHPLVQRLLFKKWNVIGIDNLLKEKQIKEAGDISAIPSNLNFSEREEKLKKIGNYEQYKYDLAQNLEEISSLIQEYKPKAIFNLAHIPSAPYSMISKDHANLTLMNNIIGTNNLLWDITRHSPHTHYITISSTGTYDHYCNINIEEGYFKIEHNGRKSEDLVFPRKGNSIYHTSKISNTYLIEYLTRIWGLKATDVMQSVVYGSYTDEIHKSEINTRLLGGDTHGTVINRFTIQAVTGVPLTVYGEGKHQRGIISLNDSIQALEIALENEPENGQARVWNQLSEWYSMNELAEMVKEVGNRKGLDIDIEHIETPRPEYTGDHYYHYKTDILESLGYRPTRSIEQEVDYTMDKIDTMLVPELRKIVSRPTFSWRKKNEN